MNKTKISLAVRRDTTITCSVGEDDFSREREPESERQVH